MQLKLDTQALTALFPPGTEARVELQSAVIAEFTRKSLRPELLGKDISDRLDAARTEALDAIKSGVASAKHAIFKEIGVAIPKSSWDNVELTDQQKNAIRQQARAAVAGEVTAAIDARLTFHMKSIQTVLDANLTAMLEKLTESEITRRFNERLAQLAALSKV